MFGCEALRRRRRRHWKKPSSHCCAASFVTYFVSRLGVSDFRTEAGHDIREISCSRQPTNQPTQAAVRLGYGVVKASRFASYHCSHPFPSFARSPTPPAPNGQLKHPTGPASHWQNGTASVKNNTSTLTSLREQRSRLPRIVRWHDSWLSLLHSRGPGKPGSHWQTGPFTDSPTVSPFDKTPVIRGAGEKR